MAADEPTVDRVLERMRSENSTVIFFINYTLVKFFQPNRYFLKIQKGAIQLGYEGHLYNFHKITSFRCQNKNKCGGMAIYKNGIFTLTVEHSNVCTPNPAKVKASIIKVKIKDSASTQNGFSPSQVVRNAISGVDEGIFIFILSLLNIKLKLGFRIQLYL